MAFAMLARRAADAQDHNHNHPVYKEYLGDGVYAVFDGYMIKLRANDFKNPTSQIYLEPEVLAALNRFAERMKKQHRVEPQQ